MRSAPPIAKVTRPEPAGYFPRRRLYRLLDKARKAPVLWISGPPGCGKTALVSGYIESRRIPSIWYKVDEGDADIATFFYYLGMAAGKAAPRIKKLLPLLTPERLPGLYVFAQRFFQDLSASLPVPSLLVLDDCHRMNDEPLFFEVVREGISRMSPGVGVFVISRNDPHPSFARDRANRLMETVEWKDLRLTLEEASGIARLHRKGRPSEELIKHLFTQADGWAAGLVLLLERKDEESVEPRTVTRQLPAEIFDYFGSEIFRRLDGERRAFLLRSAFLPKMTASMAERLTGVAQSGQVLSEMNRRNHFTEKHLQREPVYEYHALFREFLLEQAHSAFSGVELAEIRKTAAAILEEAGYVENAADLFRRSEDWESLAKLIISQASTLLTQGRNRTLLEWLGAFPGEVLENEPWLRYWNGVCIMPFSPAESRACLGEALGDFEKRSDALGVFASWTGAVDSILMSISSFTPLDEWISLLPRLLEKYGELPPGEIGERVTCSMFKALSFRRSPRADMNLWTDRALALARTSRDPRMKVETAAAYYYCHQAGRGDYKEAETAIASLRELLKRTDATPMTRLWVDYLESTHSLHVSEHERCLRVVSDGLEFAEATGVHIIDSVLLTYGALAALALGDLETANRYLGGMAATPHTMSPLVSALYHFAAGADAFVRGDLRKAALHSHESIRRIVDGGHSIDLPTAHLLAAHVHHDLHEGEEAAGHLAEARRVGSGIESPIADWLSDLTEAYFHLCRDDVASSIEFLGKGLRKGREYGLVGTLYWRPGFLDKVAAKALEAGIESGYVRDLIRRNRLMPDPGNPCLEQWPWPVKVRMLGRLELHAEDRPIEFGRKVQQRPLSLMKALVALGGKGVSEARLEELLWPDADGDMAHHSFSSALSRLRKLLGKEAALELKEGLLTLSSRHCWVDVWAFERALELAQSARKDGNEAEAVRLFRIAASFYRGPFLPYEDMAWAVPLREKLRSGFLAAVAHLGRIYEKAGRWEEAAICYRKGLETDEVAEELYRRLMVCHIRLGQETEALSVYRRCRKTLSSVLGMSPSAETRSIAASIGSFQT